MKAYQFLIIALFVIIGQNIYAQITKTSLAIEYNKKDKVYDIVLYVLEGTSKKPLDRIQFNSQISFLVPTGSQTEIVKNHMPLQDNLDYKGTIPTDWKLSKPLIAPLPNKKFDFYSINPELSNTSFFNDLKPGDKIKLISLKIKTKKSKMVRLFDSAIDPRESVEGMGMRDFTISYCIGGLQNLYVVNPQ